MTASSLAMSSGLARRGLIASALLGVCIAGWGLIVGAQADGAGVHGSIYTPFVGGRVGVMPDGPVDAQADAGRIDIPQFTVHLVSDPSGVTVASTATDVFGHFAFRSQPVGSYRLCWDAPGWVAGCAPGQVIVNHEISYLPAVAVVPDLGRVMLRRGSGAFWGTVNLADGSSPYFSDEYFGARTDTTITVTDLSGRVLGRTVTNAEGQFVIAGVPVSNLRTTAVLDGASAGIDTPALTVQSGGKLSLVFANSRPILNSVSASVNGKGVREALVGSILEATAEVSDPDGDPLAFQWKPAQGAGQITSVVGNTVVWQVSRTPGLQTLYGRVSDGKGGITSGAVIIRVTDGDVTFSGKVLTQSGIPIGGAEVAVNRSRTRADAGGAFLVTVPIADRYVSSVAAPGFATASRIFNQSGVYHEYRLLRATVIAVDPAGTINIVDRVREDRKGLLPASITLDGGTLVDAQGRSPRGLLEARIATLDITNAEMPGDYGARSRGRETNLISYGAFFAEFVDAAGNHYNLAPGRTAGIVVPVLPTLKNPPPTIALWSYNEQTGYGTTAIRLRSSTLSVGRMSDRSRTSRRGTPTSRTPTRRAFEFSWTTSTRTRSKRMSATAVSGHPSPKPRTWSSTMPSTRFTACRQTRMSRSRCSMPSLPTPSSPHNFWMGTSRS